MCAYWILCNSKNGVSSCEIARTIGVTQKSAWFMRYRIRTTMPYAATLEPYGEIEANETFIRGKSQNMHLGRRVRRITATGTKSKTAVIGLLERGGEVRATVVANRERAALSVGSKEAC